MIVSSSLLIFIGIKNMIIPIKEKIYILTFLKKSFDEPKNSKNKAGKPYLL